MLTGSGQTVGIVGFGGNIVAEELACVATNPEHVSVISFRPPGAVQTDARFKPETVTDVAIAFKCAPNIKVIVYVLEETEQGWTSGLNRILELEPVPSIMSISWGWPETNSESQTILWTKAVIDAIEDLMASLVLRGVTTVVSSGDQGLNIWYPGSSAFVLSCGASLEPGPAERVWADQPSASGGGISTLVSMPSWQSEAKIVCSGTGVPTNPNGKRCLPDVAAWALFPSTKIEIPFEGTSAAAPLWAGLIALANEYFQRLPKRQDQTNAIVGNVNSLLYDKGAGLQNAFNDILGGNNATDRMSRQFYSATRGWDACTGWGSPIAMKFIETLYTSSQLTPVFGADGRRPEPGAPGEDDEAETF